MTRFRLTSLHVLLAVVTLAAVLAMGAHEVVIHTQPCFWGPWPSPNAKCCDDP